MKILLHIVLIFIIIFCSAFKLDDFLSGEQKEITKEKLLLSHFTQCQYPDEIISYNKNRISQKILGYSAKEMIFRFSKDNKFRSAEIMIDYTNRRNPEDNGFKRIKDTETNLSNRLSSKLKHAPQISSYSCPNGRSFSIKTWKNANYRYSVYCSLTKNKYNFSFVFLRISPISEKELAFQELIKVKKITRYKKETPEGDKILIIPFRSQLPNSKGCAFTILARILNYMGSEINSLTVRILRDKPENKKRKSKVGIETVVGCKRKTIEINKRPKVESSCVKFISRYNEQAQIMNQQGIELQDNGKRWNEMLNFQFNVMKNINIDFIDWKKYDMFKKHIIKQIDKGVPIDWFVVRCINGAHGRAIIGYNLKKDIIYYSDSGSPKQEIKEVSFLPAYLITRSITVIDYGQ